MPPHLHPRSASTTSLFGATLAVSFLVVGLPHLLPCPVSPHALAEGEMDGIPNKPRRRRITPRDSDGTGATAAIDRPNTRASNGKDQAIDAVKQGRECPVPKPQGFIGHLLGFEKRVEAEKIDIKIQPLREKVSSIEKGDGR